jgi:hypothetical protein
VRAEQLLHDTISDALDLADSAADFFRGVFPLETPYFSWGDLISEKPQQAHLVSQ